MTRDLILRNTLKTILTEKEIESFFSYEISNSDKLFLKDAVIEVLRKIPQTAFNCGTLSGLLGAIIKDHSNIPVSVIAGHLDYNSTRLFNCIKPIPYSSESENINEIWDGHCWVELNNLIIDISFFRTVYFGNLKSDLYDRIVNQFGKGRGALMASPDQMLLLNFNYTPRYCLTEDQITGLVLGAEK